MAKRIQINIDDIMKANSKYHESVSQEKVKFEENIEENIHETLLNETRKRGLPLSDTNICYSNPVEYKLQYITKEHVYDILHKIFNKYRQKGYRVDAYCLIKKVSNDNGYDSDSLSMAVCGDISITVKLFDYSPDNDNMAISKCLHPYRAV